MNRYFIKLAYNGSNYHGWQIQENAHTVQAEINEKMSLLLGKAVNVVGCGRTDTGVHAREFFAHFEVNELNLDLVDLHYKLDRFLPMDIAIHDVFAVAPDMHARFSAIRRTYRYYINHTKDPFREGLSYYYHGSLDIDKMNEATIYLLDYKDFTRFANLNTQTNTNNCKIIEAKWEESGDGLIFTIKADRFLRNMVRAIVGTLLEIGKGKLEAEDMKSIIEAKDRSEAGFSVPAEGLFLEKVDYYFEK